MAQQAQLRRRAAADQPHDHPADAPARELQEAPDRRDADHHDRADVPPHAGVRFGHDRRRPRTGRHRPDLQQPRRPRSHARLRQAGAARHDHAHPPRAGRRGEDEQEPGQLRGPDRLAQGHVRQDHEHRRFADGRMVHTADQRAGRRDQANHRSIADPPARGEGAAGQARRGPILRRRRGRS